MGEPAASKRRLLIVGAGGHGRVVADCAEAVGGWSNILFFDDRWPELSANARWRVMGTIEDVFSPVWKADDAFVAIGQAETRLAIIHRLQVAGRQVATIVHPRAVVSPGTPIGPGTIIVAGAVVNIGTSIAGACIVNTGATVDHDCHLAEGVHVCPGAHLAGAVTVGERSWVGVGAAVRQEVAIGADVTIGAGAVVVSDLPAGVTAIGVPARSVAKIDGDEGV